MTRINYKNHNKQIIREILNEIKEFGIAYVFTQEHIEEIKKRVPDVTITKITTGFSLYSKSRKII